jgi:hypothetical protein
MMSRSDNTSFLPATKGVNETPDNAMRWFWRAFLTCIILASSSLTFAARPLPESIQQEYDKYFTSFLCTSCHEKITDQHVDSFHARSFSDPLFTSQYFKELLPVVKEDPELYREAKKCIACHSPIDFVVLNGRIFSEDQFSPARSGVGCVACHTIAGYDGEAPGNGNYISKPYGERVLGPFAEKHGWHHVYSELHTKSEFCAICHNAVNRYGLEIKSTYTEWKNSPYALKNIQCQDCHMNAVGFLTEGKPVYEQGCAVNPSSSFVRAPERPRLYTHRFPGAHSKTQISGTGDIAVHIETGKTVVSPGEEITIYVFIDNSKTGHKMPSGSADLRLLWMQLNAVDGDKIIPIAAASAGAGPYDVAGKGPDDQQILGDDIPGGARIYRAIFVDKTNRQTLSSYNAVQIIFDNRLNASELRKETYFFKVPDNARGKITLRASLNYLPYPSSFSRRFGLSKPESWEITSSSKELLLK